MPKLSSLLLPRPVPDLVTVSNLQIKEEDERSLFLSLFLFLSHSFTPLSLFYLNKEINNNYNTYLLTLKGIYKTLSWKAHYKAQVKYNLNLMIFYEINCVHIKCIITCKIYISKTMLSLIMSGWLDLWVILSLKYSFCLSKMQAGITLMSIKKYKRSWRKPERLGVSKQVSQYKWVFMCSKIYKGPM